MKGLILIFALLAIGASLSQYPTWSVNNNINSGESKVINYELKETVASGLSLTKIQTFNKTNFAVVPKVIIGMIGMGIQTPSKSTVLGIGFTVALFSFTKIGYKTTVTVYGTTFFLLHYTYFAVQYENTNYFLDIYSIEFDQFSELNIGSNSTKTQQILLSNPTNYDSSLRMLNNRFQQEEIMVFSWVIGFQITPISNRLSYQINSQVFNSTHLKVLAQLKNNCTIKSLQISILAINRFRISESYTYVIDVTPIKIIGVDLRYPGSPLNSFPYMFRNSEMGTNAIDLPFGNVSYYLSTSSTTDSQVLGVAVQQRKRECQAATPYFLNQTKLCYDKCIDYHFTNQTYFYCVPCHYSCFNCALPQSNSSCTACNQNHYRVLLNSFCQCLIGYYDNKTSKCVACPSQCPNCTNGICFCNQTQNFVWDANISKCVCQQGFYENISCYACQKDCLNCIYDSSRQVSQCRSCNPSSLKILSNNRCKCIDAYYLSLDEDCLHCSIQSCVSCTIQDTIEKCISCEQSAHILNLETNSCDCIEGYYKDISCKPCFSGCLNCFRMRENIFCNTCNASENRFVSQDQLACLCIEGYYLSQKKCQKCINFCSTCIYDSFYQCSSCINNTNRIISNESARCICQTGYFQNGQPICQKCQVGCLNCQNITTCIECDLTKNWTLAMNKSCVCSNLTYLKDKICRAQICGDGLLSYSEQCDDSNTKSYDGCSSLCQVEVDHTCFINETLLPYSICYYDKKILLKNLLSYKYPNQNKVILKYGVQTVNCNQALLKRYLEQTHAIKLINKFRMLQSEASASKDISSLQIYYNLQTKTLTIEFQYLATINLAQKLVQFQPSLRLSSSQTYFYSSPLISVQIDPVKNCLLTTFSTPEMMGRNQKLKIAFLSLIVLSVTFLIIGIILGNIAIAVQNLIVISFAFEGLFDLPGITNAFEGLFEYGKYIYMGNVHVWSLFEYADNLQPLSLDSNLFHTLNISLGIFYLIAFLHILTIFVNCNPTSKPLGQSQHQINGEGYPRNQLQPIQRTQNRFVESKHNSLSYTSIRLQNLKTYLVRVSFEWVASYMMITVKVIMITFTNVSEQSIIITVILSLLLIVSFLLVWLYLYQIYENETLNNFSFKNILSNHNALQNPHKGQILIIKYYYFFIFCGLFICGVLIGSTKASSLSSIFIIVGCLPSVALIIVFRIYQSRLNKIRAILNILLVIAIMIINVVHSQFYQQVTDDGFALALPLVLILSACLIINLTFFINYQWAKSKQANQSKSYLQSVDNQAIVVTENIELKKQIEQAQEIKGSSTDPKIKEKCITKNPYSLFQISDSILSARTKQKSEAEYFDCKEPETIKKEK